MKMERSEIEARCRELAYQGVEYEQIRRELEQYQLPAEERRVLLEKTDGFIVQHQLHEQYRARALGQLLLGAVVLLTGLVITVGSYLMQGSRYVFAWGAILAGAWVMKEGYKKYMAPMRDYEARGQKKKSRFHRF